MTADIHAGVRDILAAPDWQSVVLIDYGPFLTIAGEFKGQSHAGHTGQDDGRKDWKALAEELDRIARQSSIEAPTAPVRVESKPEPAPVVLDTSELDALRARLAELEAENERLRRPPPEAPAPAEGAGDENAGEWRDLEAEGALTTEHLLKLMRVEPTSVESVVQNLSRPARRKFTELLNVELAELLQERGGPSEDLNREREIEGLLGLFARVGEM